MRDSKTRAPWSFETALSVGEDVRHAVAQLKSEREGEFGIDQAARCGPRAIPALRQLLFEREPSGLYEVRRRVVDVLAVLEAYDVLMDFLRTPREAADPVERVGDEAVINAVARALAKLQEEHVFQLLRSVAERAHLIGVTAALASFQRAESIPYFVEALGADDCRSVAEVALRKFGPAAEAALTQAAARGRSAVESASSIRRRRSALELLRTMPLSPERWAALRHLVEDTDPKVALLACQIGLAFGSKADRQAAVRRLNELRGDADWMLAQEVEQSLRHTL